MSDIYEEIDEMGEKTDNQYILALAIARRVRTLREGAPALVETDNSGRKSFQTAMREIAEKKILYTLPNE